MTKLPVKSFVFLVTTALLLAILWAACAPLGELFFERGVRARREWRLDEAARQLAWAARLRPDSFDARFEFGLCEQMRGDFLASQREFDALLAGEVADPARRARLLNAAGVNRFHANEPEAAVALHQESLRLSQELGDRGLEARALIGLGRVLYFAQGRVDEAVGTLERARDIGRETGDALVEADALLSLGYVHWWFRAEHERPLREFYEPALELYRRHDDRRGVANALAHTARAWGFQRRSDIAIRLHQEGLAIRQQIGDLAGLSNSYVSIGKLYEEGGNYRRARAYYARGLDLARQTGNRLEESHAEAFITSVHLAFGEFDEAIEIYERMLKRDHATPLMAKNRTGALAYFHVLKGNHALAREYGDRALEMQEQIGAPDDRFTSWVKVVLADAYAGLGDWDEAARLVAEARSMGVRYEIDGGADWWLYSHVILAELLSKQGRRDEAFGELLESAEAETRVLSAAGAAVVPDIMPADSNRLFSLLLEFSSGDAAAPQANARAADELAFRFLEQRRYRSYRNLVLQISDRKPGALPDGRRRAARTRIAQLVAQHTKDGATRNVREQLTRAYGDYEEMVLQAELPESRYRLMRAGRPASLAEVRESLDGETALVEYLFAGEKVYALVITRAALRVLRLPATRSGLAVKVKLFRSLAFESGPTADEAAVVNRDWLPVARSLRRVLVEPLERDGALGGVRRLGLVPLGFLHDLPFAALSRDAEDGREKFLVEDYALFHLPSAGFFHARRSGGASAGDRGEFIGFGINGSGAEGLSPLEFAEEEARAAAELLSGSARTGAAASETELKREAPRHRLIHLATHAVTDTELPLLSSMQLGQSDEDDGNLTVREIFDLGLGAELVTLGACRTAQSYSAGGSAHAEVDRIGLTEAFLYAGAESVLASLLPVNDRPTTEFMKAFYSRLRTAETAEALAETQRAMLRGELTYADNGRTRRLTEPRHWAAFILVGDYR